MGGAIAHKNISSDSPHMLGNFRRILINSFFCENTVLEFLGISSKERHCLVISISKHNIILEVWPVF